eukprot:gene64-67_t
MLRYLTVPVTPFQQNASIVWCDATRQAAVIDPGGDLDTLLAAVEEHGLTLSQIWLTHAHIDHAGGTGELAQRLSLPIVGPHPGDQFWIDGLPQQSAMFGFPPAQHFTPTRWLQDGDTVQIGTETLNVRHCPGHTPGHVVFHAPQIDRAFVGDVLFAGSIGRTDFPQGNHQQLIDSITQRLWPMGNQTVFIPGHGPESTFGRERQSNPYRGSSLAGKAYWAMVQRVALTAAAIDAGYILLFLWLGSMPLAAINVLSIAMYLGAYRLIQKRYNTAALALIWLEVIGHSALGSLLIGWDSGFHYYLLMFIPAIVIANTRGYATPMVLALLAYYLGLHMLSDAVGPLDPLPAQSVKIVNWVHICVVFAMSAALSAFYRRTILIAEARLRNPLDAARATAERIRAAVAQAPLSVGPEPIALTLSFGVAQVHGSDDLQAAIARADQALYAAKHAGRNRVQLAGENATDAVAASA